MKATINKNITDSP